MRVGGFFFRASPRNLLSFRHMATKQLPGAGALMRDAWTFFITQWNECLKITVWFLYVGLIQFGLSILSSVSPFFALIYVPGEIAVAVLSLWVAVRTIQVILQLEAGKKASYSKEASSGAWRLILPLLWVGILESLIILGGLVVLIIPGLYFTVVLCFSSLFLIDDDAHGTAALGKSRDLVKGRFWATLWRLFAGGFVFGVGLMIVTGVLFALLTLIAGPSHLLALNDANELSPLAQGTIDLFQSIIQAAVVPLFLGYQIKLYRALRKTQ